MPTLPTNPHYIGDSSHVNDHNLIVTALGSAFYMQSGASSGEASTKNIDVKPWNLPWGIIGRATATSVFTTSSPHTTPQDVGLSITFTPYTTRLYKVTFLANPYPAGGLQGMVFRFIEGTTSKVVWNIDSASLETGSSLAITESAFFTAASASSTTYKLQMNAAVSNTSISDYGSATQPRMFWIEDLGPS